MKMCYGCNTEKDESEFHKETKRKDGLATQCKACRSAWYKKTYPTRAARFRETNNARRLELRDKINELKQQPCKDCGQSFPPYVMDFDHRGNEEKKGNIARLVTQSVSWATMAEEIAKCDLVCANCHRIRTYKRRLHKKLDAVLKWLTGPPAKRLFS